jgi:tetratricopeptide (TPR) repeat protein
MPGAAAALAACLWTVGHPIFSCPRPTLLPQCPMSLDFKASQAPVGEPWPWLPIGDPDHERHTRRELEPAVGQGSVPSHYISDRFRNALRALRPTVRPDTPYAAGYEKVEAAAAGSAEAMWFFDRGAGAWTLLLGQLRSLGLLPGDPKDEHIDALERAWRAGGAKAAAALDRAIARAPLAYPAFDLFRVPLCVWEGRDAAKAMVHLDKAVTRLTLPGRRAMGSTLPLTYALLHAMLGDLDAAEQALDETRLGAREAGLSGLTGPEARYHRARYLWLLGRHQEAVALLTTAVAEDASYAARAHWDTVWREPGDAHLAPAAASALGQMVEDARSQLAVWQQSRTPVEAATTEGRAVTEVLRLGGSEPHAALVAAAQLRRIRGWRDGQKPGRDAFRIDLERLQEFAAAIPGFAPIRLGTGYAPRFAGPAPSDMDEVARLVAGGRLRDAERYTEDLLHDLPATIRLASITYVTRLVEALAGAAEILQSRDGQGDRVLLQKIDELYNRRCLTLIDPVRNLTGQVGPELTDQVRELWTRIGQIEEEWVGVARYAFGEFTLRAPEELRPVPTGGFAAYALKVVDAAGNAVSAVPVLWRVASGPAEPREPADSLTTESALSLQTGLAYLAVAAPNSEGEGEIEAWIMGTQHRVRFPYRVQRV